VGVGVNTRGDTTEFFCGDVDIYLNTLKLQDRNLYIVELYTGPHTNECR
jgi:hypothetical protein